MTHEAIKQCTDVLSLTTVAATLAGWLPAIAAFFSIVWTILRIYESETVKKWVGKKNE